MNLFDVFLLILIGVCGMAGYRRGLLRTVFTFFSFIVALLITGFLYNPLTGFLRRTPLFTWLTRGISNALSLDEIYERARQSGESLIDVLPVHGFIQETLHINNNRNMHITLGATTLPEYVAAFFANMILVAIAILFIFITSMVFLSFVGGAVDIVGRLPVISRFNDVGGLLIGLVFGVMMVGLGLFVITLVFSSGTDTFVQNMLSGSMVARFVQETFMPRFFGSFI